MAKTKKKALREDHKCPMDLKPGDFVRVFFYDNDYSVEEGYEPILAEGETTIGEITRVTEARPLGRGDYIFTFNPVNHQQDSHEVYNSMTSYPGKKGEADYLHRDYEWEKIPKPKDFVRTLWNVTDDNYGTLRWMRGKLIGEVGCNLVDFEKVKEYVKAYEKMLKEGPPKPKKKAPKKKKAAPKKKVAKKKAAPKKKAIKNIYHPRDESAPKKRAYNTLDLGITYEDESGDDA